MKKTLAILLILLAAGSLAFAETTITNAQSTILTAEMQGRTELKLSQTNAFANIGAFSSGTSLATISFGNIAYGSTPSINDIYLNLITNKGSSIVIQAVPQTALTSGTITTKIGYTLSDGTNSVTINNANAVTGLTLHTFTKATHGMQLFSQAITVSLNSTDIDAAQQGAYTSTVKFNIVVD